MADDLETVDFGRVLGRLDRLCVAEALDRALQLGAGPGVLEPLDLAARGR
ncbi:MAG: hypothetical protein ACLP01_30985 [Solirubrobacteraceae bacterium]